MRSNNYVMTVLITLLSIPLLQCGAGLSSQPPAPVVTTITVSPSSTSIYTETAHQLSAAALDQNGNTISGITFKWSSSASSVATISSGGLATGVSPRSEERRVGKECRS